MEEKTSELGLPVVTADKVEEWEIEPEKQEAEEKANAAKPEKRGNPAWKKGVSGNPNGRPAGSKNKLTLLREAVLEEAEHIVLDNWVRLVEKTIELADKGDSTALKILWDRIIPSKRAVDENADKKNQGNTINIVVRGLEVESADVEKEAVEADFEEVK